MRSKGGRGGAPQSHDGEPQLDEDMPPQAVGVALFASLQSGGHGDWENDHVRKPLRRRPQRLAVVALADGGQQ